MNCIKWPRHQSRSQLERAGVHISQSTAREGYSGRWEHKTMDSLRSSDRRTEEFDLLLLWTRDFNCCKKLWEWYRKSLLSAVQSEGEEMHWHLEIKTIKHTVQNKSKFQFNFQMQHVQLLTTKQNKSISINKSVMRAEDLHQYTQQGRMSEPWEQTSPAQRASAAQHLQRRIWLFVKKNVLLRVTVVLKSLTFNWLPRCICTAEMCRLTDRHSRCCCRFKDAEIKEKEERSEAGGGGVHWREQTVHTRRQVSVHAPEERDQVHKLLPAAGVKPND